MKKTLLALAVAAVASTSVSAAEIVKNDSGSVNFYGQLRQAIFFDDDGGENGSVDAGSSRGGIDAVYKAEEGFDVIGKVEFKLTDFSDRLHYIGFATDYGTVKVGQQAPIADDVWGAEYSYEFGSGDKFLYDTYIYNDVFWQSNAIRYELDSDAGWVKAQYNLPEGGDMAEYSELFAGTSVGDLSLHAGVTHINTHGVVEVTQEADDTTGVVTETSTEVQHKATTFEITAELALGESTVGATYAVVADDSDDATYTDSDAISLAAYVPVAAKTAVYGGVQFLNDDAADQTNAYAGVEYKFASWARVYAEYGFNDTDGSDTVNQGALGARVYW